MTSTSMMKKEKREWKIPKIPGMPPAPLEKALMEDCKTLLKSLEPGIFWQRFEGSGKLIHAGGKQIMIKSEMSGTPDLFVMPTHGHSVWAEVKRAGYGTLSLDQATFIRAITSRSGRAGVVCSKEGLYSLLVGSDSNCTIADEFMVGVWF